MKKINLALLSGGNSPERDVSINSGNQVYDALDKEKYRVTRYDPKTDLVRLVTDAPTLDAALIILHGPNGEDGTVQGLLDLLGIPYQGTGVLGSALAMNKIAAKQHYERAGLPIPQYLTATRRNCPSVDVVADRIGIPVVVKPGASGSSIGMSIVQEMTDLPAALEKAFAQNPEIIVEEYIAGTEITAGVLGNDDLEALPLIEIIPDQRHMFFDYEAKYTAGETQEICPARIDDALTRTAQNYAVTAHQVLHCRGYSRTDMIIRKGRIYVLETNTIPGMTPTSLFPQAAQVAGMSFSRMLDRLIELGMEAKTGNPENP